MNLEPLKVKTSYSFETSGLIHTTMQGDMPKDQNTFQRFFIKILYVVFIPPTPNLGYIQYTVHCSHLYFTTLNIPVVTFLA